jgi:hypothetical protein
LIFREITFSIAGKIGVYKKPNKVSDRFVRFYQEIFWSKPIIPNKPITKKMLGMRRKKI